MHPIPNLCNLDNEATLRKACHSKALDETRVGGLKINNLKYANDTTLITTIKEGLVYLLGKDMALPAEKL